MQKLKKLWSVMLAAALAFAALPAGADNLTAKADETVPEIPLTAAMVTGSEPYGGDYANGADKTVDGSYETFFDGQAWGEVKIDLGAVYRIKALGYAPRQGYADRCEWACFYGSNDGESWTRLYVVSKTPAEHVITRQEISDWITDSNYYRYIRYSTDNLQYANVSELKLYGEKADPESLAADYREKEKAKICPKNETKEIFETALAAAESLEEDASEEEKQSAMEAVVTAYDALSGPSDDFSGVKGGMQYDIDGNLIQAHGGQVQKLAFDYDYDGDGIIAEDEKEFWYWIGEDKTYHYTPCPGIRGYISKDLTHWKDMGNVLRTVPNWETFTTEPYFTELYGNLSEEEQRKIYADIWNNDNSGGGCVIERPKLLYNEKNDNYVIWFHADGQTPDSSSDDNYAKAKAGVAVSDSPFGPFRLLGSYLLNYNPNAGHGFDGDTGGHVRDMNLFLDQDKTAYVIYSSDGNETLHIAKLNEDYTHVAQPENEQAKEGVDFARTFIGESREAPAMFRYRDKYYLITSGCTGWDPNEASYAVADHPLGPWTTVGNPCMEPGGNKTYFTQSTCVIPVDADRGKFIYMGDRWYRHNLKESEYIWTPLDMLPGDRISIRRSSDWTLEDLGYKGDLIYFFDCGADESESFDTEDNILLKNLRNTAANQPYEGHGAGYTGIMEEEIGSMYAGDDAWEHGFWAKSDQTIAYAFDLEPGNYTVVTGYLDWWREYHPQRPLKVSITAGDEQLASKKFTLDAEKGIHWEKLSFSVTENTAVKAEVSKTADLDGVLSWIAVIKETGKTEGGGAVTPEKPDEKDPAEKPGQEPEKDTVNAPVKITSVSFAEKTYKIAAGRNIDLNKELQILPAYVSDSAVTWSLDAKSSKYAVMKNGVVTTKQAGAGRSVTVTAETKDGSGQKASVKIKIMKNAVTKISVKQKKLTVKAGKKATIKPDIKTNGRKANKKLAWTSSNTEYASVNAKGTVKTKKAGAGKTITVTARSTDGTNKYVKVKIKIRK